MSDHETSFEDLVPRSYLQEHRLTQWSVAGFTQYAREKYERCLRDLGKAAFATQMWHARWDSLDTVREHLDLETHRMVKR